MPLDIRKLELELAIKQAVLEVDKMKIEADNQKAIINQEAELKKCEMEIHQQTELKKCEIEAKNKQDQLKQELELEKMKIKKIKANEERARLDRMIDLEKCQLDTNKYLMDCVNARKAPN